jgi:site-specific recombinase XerD
VAPAQRKHRPHDLGPRVEFRGRWASADLRPWGGSRYTTLRDPKHPRWPKAGERTEDEDIARRWSWEYVDLLSDRRRAHLLGHRGPSALLEDEAKRFINERERAVRRNLVSYNTFKTNRTAVHHLTEAVAGSRPADQIGVDELQRVFDELADHGYAPGTLHSYRFSLSVFFEFIGLGPSENPARLLVVPDLVESDARAWEEEEVEQLQRAADELDREGIRIGGALFRSVRLTLEMALAAGLREQELFGMRWEDINWRDRTVRVQRQLVRHSDQTKPLKGKRARTALILPGFESFYQEGGPGLVIAGPGGKSIGTQAQRDLMDALLDRADLNLPGVRYHVLRHTYARRFIEWGGRVEELQKSLGHASISITERTYEHFRGDRAAESARQRIYRDGGIRLIG